MAETRWRGVRETPGGVWFAVISLENENRALPTAADAREAAEMYDRMARHYRGDKAILNFPDRDLPPASFEELRAFLHARKKATRSSRFRGVVKVAEGWAAYVSMPSGAVRSSNRHRRITTYDTEEEAAVAHDRAALFLLGEDAILNFPKRRLTPASALVLRAERRRKKKKGPRGENGLSSKYFGVSYDPASDRWLAQIHPPDGDYQAIGRYASEEEAAIAYDRAALHYFGPDVTRNFPERRLRPKSGPALRRAVRDARKREMSSRFHGVTWCRRLTGWMVQVKVGGQGHAFLFRDQLEAARAYDRLMLGAFGPGVTTFNFPEEVAAGRTKPIDLDAMSEEQWTRYKETTSSQYTGVSWDKKREAWVAYVNHDGQRHRLGVYDDEVSAARAHDKAALRLRGGPAGRLNFE